MEEIIPAIQLAKKGIDVDGPVPQILFSKAYGGMYDIVVAMYHERSYTAEGSRICIYKERQVEGNIWCKYHPRLTYY